MFIMATVFPHYYKRILKPMNEQITIEELAPTNDMHAPLNVPEDREALIETATEGDGDENVAAGVPEPSAEAVVQGIVNLARGLQQDWERRETGNFGKKYRNYRRAMDIFLEALGCSPTYPQLKLKGD